MIESQKLGVIKSIPVHEGRRKQWDNRRPEDSNTMLYTFTSQVTAAVYMFCLFFCWFWGFFLTIHSAKLKSAIGFSLFCFLNICLQSITLDSYMGHQGHSYGFWAQLPLTIFRPFRVQEIITGLCAGDFSIFLKLTGVEFDICGEIWWGQSEERNTTDSYPSVRYIFPWNLSLPVFPWQSWSNCLVTISLFANVTFWLFLHSLWRQ